MQLGQRKNTSIDLAIASQGGGGGGIYQSDRKIPSLAVINVHTHPCNCSCAAVVLVAQTYPQTVTD